TTAGANAATTLNSGTLILGGNNAIAGGTLNLMGGTLQASTPVNLTNTVNLNNSAVTISGSNAIVFSGPMVLAGQNDTLTVSNTAATIVTGVVQDAANNPARVLTKAGTGTLTLTGANTYTALTNLLSGTLNVQNNSALGLSASNAVAGNANSGST